MGADFFARPVVNSPYAKPEQHWELDEQGQPTHELLPHRRRADFVTPIPKPNRQSGAQARLELSEEDDSSQEYDPTSIINELRTQIDQWRNIPSPEQWLVTPETARLLQHWRHHEFQSIRPFFCQIEAVETLIWLTEVAPKLGERGQRFLRVLDTANDNANPGLLRTALKLATGAGKTTVMAMIIAWQTVNAVRRPNSKKFSRGFIVVTPGITIRDRLSVLHPNDPNSYYESRELLPTDMLAELYKARVVITNYHTFKRRQRMELSAGGRAMLQGRTGPAPETLETEGQMLQRAVGDLMGLKGVMALNDEAHHCYREKPEAEDEEGNLTGDDREEAKKNREAARLWISGLEAINRTLGLNRVVDLSATPFFLRGSGYREGTLFPWTMSDFSLMDAIECGIVKLPRVPVDDNIPGEEMPIYRNLWEHIRDEMPRTGRSKNKNLDPHDLPTQLETALDALYGHYTKTFELWAEANMEIPPCFIIVCNNTATSKLLYDYVSGFERSHDGGSVIPVPGKFELFRNHDENGNALARPRTLLIDSEQLESGEALDKKFRDAAAAEIDHYKRERVERSGNPEDARNITDQDLLREVMNTVGKAGQLGGQIRCVVSVSMLTEGWDANNVTHVLGVRAFGTQLLCEQVVGRALRRESYETDEDGLLSPRYADVLGIPFDFNAEPTVAPPQKPRDTVWVHAVRPERDGQAIRFPRVSGYRVDLPTQRFTAEFTEDSVLELTPDLIGPAKVKVAGIVGEQIDLNLIHTGNLRQSTVLFHLTRCLIEHWRESGQEPPLHLFGQLKRIARQWMDECLVCKGGTYPAQLLYNAISARACEKISAAITRSTASEDRPIRAILDAYNPTGSTNHVGFSTTRTERHATRPDKCHVDWVILDSGWEGEFCRVAEEHPAVLRYVKNHSLGFEVPYRLGGERRTYRPDFIVEVDDGHCDDDPLHLVVEIKGYRGEDAQAKRDTMLAYWVPGVNHLASYGRWDFVEFGDVYEMQEDFAAKLEAEFEKMINERAAAPA